MCEDARCQIQYATIMSTNTPETKEEAEKRQKREEGLKALNSSLLAVTKIPWLEKSKLSAALKLEDSNLFKMMQQEHRHEFSHLMRLVNECTPFYHPQRYVRQCSENFPAN